MKLKENVLLQGVRLNRQKLKIIERERFMSAHLYWRSDKPSHIETMGKGHELSLNLNINGTESDIKCSDKRGRGALNTSFMKSFPSQITAIRHI